MNPLPYLKIRHHDRKLSLTSVPQLHLQLCISIWNVISSLKSLCHSRYCSAWIVLSSEIQCHSEGTYRLHLLQAGFLFWLTPWPVGRWRSHIPLHYQFSFTGLNDTVSQEAEYFISTAMRISNQTKFFALQYELQKYIHFTYL